MTEASRDAAAKKCDPPRLDLGKIDLKKPPSKALLAAECETRGLPVKRKGDAPDGEPTELAKALVQRLREHHDGRISSEARISAFLYRYRIAFSASRPHKPRAH